MNVRKVCLTALKSVVLSSLLLLLSCSSSYKNKYSVENNTVTINLKTTTLNVEVLNDHIFHITKNIKDREGKHPLPDFVTTLSPESVNFKVEENKGCLIITTNNMYAVIDEEGNLSYFDTDGTAKVAEKIGGSYFNFEDTSNHQITQEFTVGDEALYGLGQYQSGIMNWKNVPVRLEQFNQEIAIPFLVSTNGYGIYWHNYSLTDFNMPTNELKFPKIKVSDKEEEFEVGEKENVAARKNQDVQESLRKTSFVPKKTGQYSFYLQSNEGERMRGNICLTFNNDTVINYSTIWVPSSFSGKAELEAGKEYEVTFRNDGASIEGRVYFNEPDYDKTVFASKLGDKIDYYIIGGDNPVEVVEGYRELTGDAPMFEKKSYGFWQCREKYSTQDELLENANQFRKRKIPVDNIVLDWFYWPKGTKGPEWDRGKFYNPKGMVDELTSLNLNFMVSVWPEVRNEPMLANYGLNGLKVGSRSDLDFYNTKVPSKYYQMLSDSMFHIGVKSIWLDGTEGSRNDDDITALGKLGYLRNTYSLMVTKAMYEGRREEFPKQRVFNLTRSSYAGQQRYGATSWSGDVQATWEQLTEQIPAGLNFTMAGVPYWTHDIGGFFRDSNSMNPIFKDQYTDPEFIELLTRWFQFGAFSPIFRIHGYRSKTEIWRYNSEFESTARKFIDLRYQLMPYIYSEAWKVTSQGRNIMNSLVSFYPEDKKTWEIKDQFFFGESIMLGFVTEYKKRDMQVYLPQGEWYDYWTGKRYDGGKNINTNAPLESTPMFIKAGSIIPTGPKLQYATQSNTEPLTITIYPGKDAQYKLYLDDNLSYNYEEGVYSEIEFSYSDESKILTIKSDKDSFANFSDKPIDFTVTLVNSGNIQKLQFEGEEIIVQLK